MKLSKKQELEAELALEQVLVPSLKILQKFSHKKVEKVIFPLLQHKDSSVRWDALLVFAEQQIPLDSKVFETIIDNDNRPFIREKAKIMLEIK